MRKGRILEKRRKLFRDTESVPFMLDKSRKPLLTQLGTKNFVFEKTSGFRKCRIVPKNVKGGTFWDLSTFCYKISKKLEGGPFGDI